MPFGKFFTMKAKILILSVLMIAVLVSSGCVQQKCPDSCEDSNDCTKDYCSTVTDYECRNDPIIPCCGNKICEDTESYKSCLLDCQKPLDVGNLEAGNNFNFSFPDNKFYVQYSSIYNVESNSIKASSLCFPIKINERVRDVEISGSCNLKREEAITSFYFDCLSKNCKTQALTGAGSQRSKISEADKGAEAKACISQFINLKENKEIECNITFSSEVPPQVVNKNVEFWYVYNPEET